MRVCDISKAFALALGMILGNCNLFAEDLEITATALQEGMAKFEIKFDQRIQASDLEVREYKTEGCGVPSIERNNNSFSVIVSNIDDEKIDAAILEGNGFKFMLHLDGCVGITKTAESEINTIKIVSPQWISMRTHVHNKNAVDLEKLSVACNVLLLRDGINLTELEADCKEVRTFSGRTNIERVKLLGDDVSVFASITPLKSFSCPNARQLTIGRGVKMSEGCTVDINKNAQVFKD